MTKEYVDYQQKYRNEPRESDKFLIRLIRENVLMSGGKSLLDIGCHNGNLLFQIKKEIPGLILKGGDLFSEVIEQCKVDPDLSGISFEVLDILDLHCNPVDLIVVNAVLFRFNREQHQIAWRNIGRALKPGGLVFVFDWYHAFNQTLHIVEETPEHPDGLILNIRSQDHVSRTLQESGFNSFVFYPFRIGMDLPLADPASAHFTYTKKLSDGERQLFRGSLFQPWCHLLARKDTVSNPLEG